MDLNFSNWILWILGDFHRSNWFLGAQNPGEKFTFLFFKHCAGSIPSVTPEICDSQMKICQTGDRSKGWKFSSLSHDMIEPRTTKLSPLSMQDRYKSRSLDHFLIYLLFSRTKFNFKISTTPIYINKLCKAVKQCTTVLKNVTSLVFAFFAFTDVTKYLTQIFEGSTKSTVGMSDRLWSLKFDGCKIRK